MSMLTGSADVINLFSKIDKKKINKIIGGVVVPTNDLVRLSAKHYQLTGMPVQQLLCMPCNCCSS